MEPGRCGGEVGADGGDSGWCFPPGRPGHGGRRVHQPTCTSAAEPVPEVQVGEPLLSDLMLADRK